MDVEERSVPDFICIGSQKAGTTWLYNQLIGHPGIAIPRKESNILYRAPDVTAAYDAFFDETPGGRLKGDISPVYAAVPGIADQIAMHCPDARLLLLIRDPVDRAFSQYCMATRARRIDPAIPFRKAFDRNLQFMQRRGCYAEILSDFEAAGGGRENILVAPFDWIGERPKQLLEVIFQFLRIEPVFDEEAMRRVFGAQTRAARIAPADAEYVRAWYRAHNARLGDRLWWREARLVVGGTPAGSPDAWQKNVRIRCRQVWVGDDGNRSVRVGSALVT